MGPKTELLIKKLDEIAPLLTSEGHSQWAEWMLKAAATLKNEDFQGIRKVLSAYGGMGSFNDLNLNERTSLLREEIGDLAGQIADEVRR